MQQLLQLLGHGLASLSLGAAHPGGEYADVDDTRLGIGGRLLQRLALQPASEGGGGEEGNSWMQVKKNEMGEWNLQTEKTEFLARGLNLGTVWAQNLFNYNVSSIQYGLVLCDAYFPV